MISKDLLCDIIDSLSSMIDYADDGCLSRDDNNYSEFFEAIDNASELLNKLWKIYELEDYSYIENKEVQKILKE